VTSRHYSNDVTHAESLMCKDTDRKKQSLNLHQCSLH